MLDIEKFRDAHESRRTPTEGVTLVAFYSHDKPKSLSDLTVSFWEGGSPHLQVTPSGGLRYDGGHAYLPSRRPYRL